MRTQTKQQIEADRRRCAIMLAALRNYANLRDFVKGAMGKDKVMDLTLESDSDHFLSEGLEPPEAEEVNALADWLNQPERLIR